jgi:hypothetical protein
VATLLTVDPDLGHTLSPEEAPRAARALPVWVVRVRPGAWAPRLRGRGAALGLLVVEGLIVREVAAAGGYSAELLGAGDLIRPWQDDEESTLAGEPSWFVADEARIALLDSSLTTALAEWPSVAAELFGRALRRARRGSTERAITQVRRVEERTLLYLWYLSERFGRVTPEGIVTRIPLTHERLAVLACMQRPSLTTALSKLERSGLLVRGADYEYVLTAEALAAVPALVDRLAPAA